MLSNTGRAAEAADDARQALAVARESGYPAGELLALMNLSLAALAAGDLDGAVQLARQAGQITGIPGSMARVCRSVLTAALTDAGDLAAAGRVCAAALAWSRDAEDLWSLPVLLRQMADVDLRAGRIQDAAAHLREALQIAIRAGSQSEQLEDLQCCGFLCAAAGRPAEAVTVWAAYAALSGHDGFTEMPAAVRRRDGSLRAARQALGAGRTRAAEDRGMAMNLGTAAEYALMLTAAGPSLPATALSPGQLSARERELVTLVARGRTDAQIAAELFISVRTVSSHLDRIRDKTGCRRRADLTRLALSAGLV
jgi:DNA-binding CsgD family transcriptional regulator